MTPSRQRTDSSPTAPGPQHAPMGLADRVHVLDFGRTLCDGPPAEVQAGPNVVAAYLGTTSEQPADESAEVDRART